MLGLSLWQPWASLIVLGEKSVETRSWAPPSSMIGQRIAIHASKKWGRDLLEMTLGEPFASALARHGIDLLGRANHAGKAPCPLPLGAIVGTAVLDAVHRTRIIRSSLGMNELAFGDYNDGRFAWVLRDVRRLEDPIRFRGKQKFFPVSDDAAVLMRAAGVL